MAQVQRWTEGWGMGIAGVTPRGGKHVRCAHSRRVHASLGTHSWIGPSARAGPAPIVHVGAALAVGKAVEEAAKAQALRLLPLLALGVLLHRCGPPNRCWRQKRRAGTAAARATVPPPAAVGSQSHEGEGWPVDPALHVPAGWTTRKGSKFDSTHCKQEEGARARPRTPAAGQQARPLTKLPKSCSRSCTSSCTPCTCSG